MTTKEYNERMKAHHRQFEALWAEIARDTNKYIESGNNEGIDYNVEQMADQFALSCAWLYDRLNDKSWRAKGSMTVKIRKALGYTYP